MWCRNGFAAKLKANTALPGVMLQAHDAPAGTNPPVFHLKVNSDGTLASVPVALGSGDAGAPVASGGDWVSAVAGCLPLSGGAMSGAIVLPGPPAAANEAASKDYVDSSVAAGGAEYLPLAGGTLTGPLNAMTAMFSGAVDLNRIIAHGHGGDVQWNCGPPRGTDLHCIAAAGG